MLSPQYDRLTAAEGLPQGFAQRLSHQRPEAADLGVYRFRRG